MRSVIRLVAGNLVGLVLLGGFGCEGPVPGAGPAAPAPKASPASGQVSPAKSLTVARAVHTATRLPNGKVLLAGGMAAAGTSAETFDPVEGRFAPAGRLSAERAGGHAAVLLPSGSVLLVGGWSGSSVTASAERFDPATNAFTATGAMDSPRSAHTAILLPSGKVLVAGGFDGTRRLASAELYDPRTGKFEATGSMAEARSEFAAALLPRGQVLITGGNRSNGQLLASAEIYDSAAGSFRRTGDLATVRHKHAATALRDGRVLITGGSDARDGRGRYATAELFDPARGIFTSVPAMGAKRFKHASAVVLLQSGQVLVAGGDERVEVYDPATATFRIAGGNLGAELSFSTATLLDDGRVLIAGGYDPQIQPTAGAWLFRR